MLRRPVEMAVDSGHSGANRQLHDVIRLAALHVVGDGFACQVAVFYRGIGVIRGELGLAVSDRAQAANS